MSRPLVVDDVRAGYGAREVLHGVGFAVEPGEVFGLIGLNGVGKTTLIRGILGLTPARGTLSLFGRPNAEPAARRGLFYLPEKYMPAAQLTGWEHLEIAQGWLDGPLDRDAARALAEGLALEPAALDRRVRTYSKGMGQKLGLVAALLSRLPLLILDEPMSGLDPRARVRLKDHLKAYRGEGRSVFFSSHVLADVEEICDRIGVLHGGRLLYCGTPAAFVAAHGGVGLERAFLAAIDAADDR
ncbi:ABC transporter ATP-binding protein [Novispirillum sp. DQ9]|uniref:ABC transporter ATP-binding protein n=1 Tax=Novispirillum sp. DQ9 TaxID=3398612 RepID=UPI003C7C280C